MCEKFKVLKTAKPLRPRTVASKDAKALGSPQTVIGKRPRASLVSALRQNRIFALFATHVVRAGLVLTRPLSASDRAEIRQHKANVRFGPETDITQEHH